MASDLGRSGSSTENVVTVLGATGFLGRRIVSRLLDKKINVRAASRHPARDRFHASPHLKRIEANILDRSSIAAAISGSRAVVNAVSLYVERGEQSFERVHVKAAADLAAVSREAGVGKFIQISGIGSDAKSSSTYVSARGRGEDAVKSAFAQATIVRPSVMVGPGDTFLTTIIRLVKLLPVYPLFGTGDTQLQPVHVEDVAEAVARLASGQTDIDARLFECAGPRVYSYRSLVQEIASLLRIRTILMPVPYPVWTLLAAAAEWLPAAPLTRNQVELMQDDNIASGNFPGLEDLSIEPCELDVAVRMIDVGHT